MQIRVISKKKEAVSSHAIVGKFCLLPALIKNPEFKKAE